MATAIPSRKLRFFAGSTLLLAAAMAQAATGYIVTPQQEKSIRVGMSRDEVRKAIGRPAHNLKYRNEPGRTWTCGVPGSDNKVFDVDFTSDGKVAATAERVENNED